MADHAIVDEVIFLTFNDVGTIQGEGKRGTEANLENLFQSLHGPNFLLSGLTVPASSGNLNINVAAGDAFIAGHRISIPGATAVTAADASTNFVFLKFNRDGSNQVTDAEFEVNTSGTPPADSLLLASLIAAGGVITSTQVMNFKGGVGQDQLRAYRAGANVFAEANTVQDVDGTGFVKYKEIQVARNGEIRFEWEQRGVAANATVSEIRRNGTAVGVQKSTTAATFQVVTDDIGGWTKGDLAQLFSRETIAAGIHEVQNFKLKNDETIVEIILLD